MFLKLDNVSETTMEILFGGFVHQLREILDDPYFYTGGDKDYEFLISYRKAAEELGLDFDNLLHEVGTKFEVARLLKLEKEVNAAPSAP